MVNFTDCSLNVEKKEELLVWLRDGAGKSTLFGVFGLISMMPAR